MKRLMSFAVSVHIFVQFSISGKTVGKKDGKWKKGWIFWKMENGKWKIASLVLTPWQHNFNTWQFVFIFI